MRTLLSLNEKLQRLSQFDECIKNFTSCFEECKSNLTEKILNLPEAELFKFVDGEKSYLDHELSQDYNITQMDLRVMHMNLIVNS